MSKVEEVLFACIEHFEATDRANAAMRCVDVRYSPITFKLVEALDEYFDSQRLVHLTLRDSAEGRIRAHVGQYDLDPSR